MIDIYSMKGKKLRTLVSGFKNAGSYEVVWDGRSDCGSEIAGGVYFINLSANGSSVSKKVTIIR